MKGRIRPAAVAGTFYPGDRNELRRWVAAAVERARRHPVSAKTKTKAKAIIAPHAGYVYSGGVAATAYAALAADAGRPPRRIVILGPAHTVPLESIAASSAAGFATPLGVVSTDTAGRDTLVGAGLVTIDDEAHAAEHSLEVHLPFLQVLFGEGITVLPLVVGAVPAIAVAQVLAQVWDDPDTAVVVSTDLSHYHDYETAAELDRATAAAIVSRDASRLGPRSACGVYPLRGLLAFAADRGIAIEQLDLRSSGDTAGPRDRVVGYGAFAVG